MKKRLIGAAILIIIFVPLLIIGKIPFALGVTLIGLLCLYEMNKLYKYPLPVQICGFISFILILFSNFDSNLLSFGISYKYMALALLLTLIPIIFYQPSKKYTTEDAFKYFCFIFLVSLGLNLFIVIRDEGLKYSILSFLIPIITDTFAYLGGSLIGKHKATKISPNKSWEGFICGSVMGTFVSSMYYFTVINNNTNILAVSGIILLLTIVGQIGDLFFSGIKRDNNIKDFSKLIPEHGGMLDRVDSWVFVAILLVVFINYL